MPEKSLPPPPVKIYGVSYISRNNTLTGELESIFDRNQRIVHEVDSQNEFQLEKLFRMFDKNPGVPSYFESLVDIFSKHPKDIVKRGVAEMIRYCETNMSYKTKVKEYFIKSLAKFIQNIHNEKKEKEQTEKSEIQSGVIPVFYSEADGIYLEYLKYLYSDRFSYFTTLYKCTCNRIVIMEQDRCPSCKSALNWKSLDPERKAKVEKYKTDSHWEEFYEKKFKTKNYGDWPE